MARTRAFWRAARDAALAFTGLSALALAVFVYLRDPAERPARLKLTAGRFEGERHRIAESLARECAALRLQIERIETPGSEEALRRVDRGEIDVALAQGGLSTEHRPNLRQVATLDVEPLHLLVKEEIHQEVSDRLSALRGRTVGVGEPGSGTNRLAREVLRFAGLRSPTEREPGDYRPNTQGYAELRRVADRSRLPDAVFLVSTLPSPIARHLVAAHRYRLVPLPFQEAFTLGALDDETSTERGESGIDRRRVHSAEIPAFTYEVEPGVPPRSLPTLGTRLLVVAHKDASVPALERLLDVLRRSPIVRATRGSVAPLDKDEAPPEIPWHEAALARFRRDSPIIAGDVIDLIEKEVSIGGALLGGLFFLAQWLRRRYRRRREQGFESYILAVALIERQAIRLEKETRLDLPALLKLQDELGTLKGEALDKFVDGDLDGEELMSSFITHVSDTRDFLTRLILHARAVAADAERLGDVGTAPSSIAS